MRNIPLSFALIFVLMLLACTVPSEFSAPIGGIQPTATSYPTPTQTTTSVPIQPTPTKPVIDQEEVLVLAKLCVVEARGFKRGTDRVACLSSISTVYARMEHKIFSDGTVNGTITFDCRKESEWCHFPASIVNGCEGIIPIACVNNYPDKIRYFTEIVRAWKEGNMPLKGLCAGYLYYGSRESDVPDCVVTDGYSFIRFTNGSTKILTRPKQNGILINRE